ncbi:hypothetical protein ACEN2J_16420 [Pseudorhodobacter sp. W20_MBD10_FR17]|uniref:hypothetical protein n=1 Tax=Pseudorhodobacter sp. W20_MBD10_FR17 TaxID=3240266 RepID=UPI003F947FFF
MTRILMAVLVLGAMSGCAHYTEKTSPCFGRSGKPIATNAAFISDLPLITVAEPLNTSKDCTFRAIGISA